MQELIKVSTNTQGERVVSARELHTFLQAKSNVNTWFKNQVERAMLEENTDYQRVQISETSGQTSFDYALTLSASKEIAMLNGGEKGKQARQYFLECEKALKEIAKPLSTLDYLEMSLKQMREQETRISTVENKILEIEAKNTTRPEYFTIMGYAILQGAKVGLSLAAQLGKKAKPICSSKGYHVDKIHDPRFGQVGCYPADVLKEVFNTTTFA